MITQIEIELNKDGIVQNSGIHDAAIIETMISGEGEAISAVIRCRSEDGTRLAFQLEGVRLFCINFFGSQNVISDCQLITRTSALALLSEINDLEKYTFEKIDHLNDLIKEGKVTLLRFIPSVGASIDCLCRGVVLQVE